MRLSLELKAHFFSKSYAIISNALKEATYCHQTGTETEESPILRATVYHQELKKLQEVLSEICSQISDPVLPISILVAYLRSSLLHYDGRIDLYLTNTWGDRQNIINEACINSMLWHPVEIAKRRWAHLLERVAQLNRPLILDASQQLSEFANTNKWLYVQVSGAITEVMKLAGNVGDLNSAKTLSRQQIEDMIARLQQAVSETEALTAKKVLCLDDEIPDTTDVAKKMLANPIRVLAKFHLLYLVYLPFITIAEDGGANQDHPLDGGVVLSFRPAKRSELSSKQLKLMTSVSEDLREAISECIVFPLLCAEDRWLGMQKRQNKDNEPYYNKFFSSTQCLRLPLVDDLLNFGETGNLTGHKIALHIGGCLNELARKSVSGIDAIAYELYVGIRDLWNELSIVRSEIEPAIGIGSGILGNSVGTTVNIGRDNMKPLINLLGKLLDFEQQLKYIPRYRDHFVHSIHVLSVGTALVSKLPCFREWRENESFWRAWFMTSLFHDIGIPITKAPDALQKLISKDLRLLEQNVHTEISWHYLLVAKAFHNMLQQEELDKLMRAHPEPQSGSPRSAFPDRFSFLLTKQHTQCPHVRLSHNLTQMIAGIDEFGGSRKSNHGILSGLLLQTQAESDLYSAAWKEAVRAAVLPTMLHHIWEKDKDKDDDCEFLLHGRQGFLLYLLILSDSICQSGRDFRYILENDSDQPILFADMSFGNNAQVTLDYSNWQTKGQLLKMIDCWKNYVDQPCRFSANFDRTAAKIPAVTINYYLSPTQQSMINSDEDLLRKMRSLAPVTWCYDAGAQV